jgi:3',5'-cyclic AMP phosphodiesterase CpdA
MIIKNPEAMPYIYGKKSRRQFLKTMAGGAGALAAMSVLPSFVLPGKKETLQLALLSDTHLPEDRENVYRGFYPYRDLQKGVEQIGGQPFDLAIITGDLARLEGKPGDYTAMKGVLSPLAEKMPVAMALGNHDVRDHFLAVFPETPGERAAVEGKYVQVIEHPGIRLILLDSLVFTNHSPALGQLGKKQREWLAQYLKEHTDKAVFLFLHHTLDDNDGSLVDADRFLRIIRPYRHVKAVFYGHSHVYGYEEQEGLHLINLPAMGYNFRDEDPVGWVEAGLTPEKGTFRLHTVAGDTARDGEITRLTWRS